MDIYLSVAIYLICWWIVLFAVLPLRIGPQPDQSIPDQFADAAGAPRAPNIALKFLVTTVVSSLIFAVIYVILAFKIITLDNLPF
jgi:predicted secreted protein